MLAPKRRVRSAAGDAGGTPLLPDGVSISDAPFGFRRAAVTAAAESRTERNRKNLQIQTEVPMPKKHLRGVGKKEQREYEHIKNSAQKSGRYGKRAKEVAARTVMKHHKQAGHKKGQ